MYLIIVKLNLKLIKINNMNEKKQHTHTYGKFNLFVISFKDEMDVG